MMLNKFQTITNRIMTPDEALHLVDKMDLPPDAKVYIHEQFTRVNDGIEICQTRGNEHFDAIDPNEVTGENGRIAFGMSWESVMEQLGKTLGYTEDQIWNEPVDLRVTFDAFFEE